MAKKIPLENALYVVATPIGCLQDISLRALDVLAEVDLILAEDTRQTQKLLQHYAIKQKLISLHAHNESKVLSQVVRQLQQGVKVAMVSDAGTPLISDPGAMLVSACHDYKIKVVPIPGACAAIAALSAAGLPSQHFVFTGFLPIKKAARQAALLDFEQEARAVVCYESPRRLTGLLEDIVTVLGADRQLVLAREITKKFETICRDHAGKILEWVKNDSNQVRGEVVLIIAGQEKSNSDDVEARRVWEVVSPLLSHRDAVQVTVKLTGVSKKVVYGWDKGAAEDMV